MPNNLLAELFPNKLTEKDREYIKGELSTFIAKHKIDGDSLSEGDIASGLVNFVTSEKQDRQIIIVTHNASLVICADTENIIVSDIKSAGSSKYDFSYATGFIKNPDRRSDIIEVLEGGESALKKRMLKLSVN